ncbi:MAG: ribonuclease H-like domain-containing protein [Chlamydiota bacterium]
MIDKTFCHFKGISANSEKLLWENGIENWDDFLQKINHIHFLPASKLQNIKNEIPSSKEALEKKDLSYFKNRLHPKNHWRLFNLGKIAFLDIETTGLSKWTDSITIIGIYDGTTPHLYVKDKNLLDAKEKLKEFEIIVTFNGKQFDLPFVEHHFSHSYDFIHLDLRYMLKELGLSGGLKSIERQLGITRGSDIEGIDGWEAVTLWRLYKKGNPEALKKLLKYNEADIVNLKTLLEYYIMQKT